MRLFEFLRRESPDISRYLPKFTYENDKSLKDLLKVSSWEHEKQRQILIDIEKQFFVETATWGLADWERIVDVMPNPGDNYTQRRNRILLKLNGTQTSTVEFLKRLTQRYVSEDSEVSLIEYPKEYRFMIILKNGLLLYADDLIEAINLYKPAHLGFGLEMQRDIYMDDEGKIRIGIASMFEGFSKIGLYIPNSAENSLKFTAVPAKSGIVKVSVGFAKNEKFGVKYGTLNGVFGIREICVDKNDLPEAFKERDLYIAHTLGLASDLKGKTKIFVRTPENGALKIGFAAKIANTGRKLYGLDPPKGGALTPAVGEVTLYNGDKEIKADLSDLPQEYKEKNSRITPKIGFSSVVKSKKQIGVEKPTDEATTSKVGFFDGVFGVSIINIDKNDLSNEYKEKDAIAKFFAGFTHTVKSYKRIPTAKVEKSKNVFALGTVQKVFGKKTIPAFSLDKTKNKLYAGSMECIKGYKVIGADLSVLNN